MAVVGLACINPDDAILVLLQVPMDPFHPFQMSLPGAAQKCDIVMTAVVMSNWPICITHWSAPISDW
jgi:hypothetical protein